MPDGSLWCSLTMRPCERVFIKGCPEYEFGSGQIYKAKPKRIQVPEKITKTKVKEVKPKPPPKIKQKKTIPGQTRLF